MTYVMYIFWCVTCLMAAGEMDRLWGRRVCERYLDDLTNRRHWFIPPLATLALPGAGQLLNCHPVKAIVGLLGAVAIAAVPRPPQFLALSVWWLILPWYLMVVVDALAGALLRRANEALLDDEWTDDPFEE